MVKITIIAPSYPPEKGAAPNRVYNLAMMLQERGYDVQVITSMPNYPTGSIFKDYKSNIRKDEEWEGVKLRRLWLYPSNSKNALKRLASMCSQAASLFILALPGLLKRKPDIIIVNTPPLLMAYAGVTIGKLCGCKTIVNISDIWPLTALHLGAIKEGWFYRLLQKIEKRIYRKADACVGQSKEIIERVEEVCGKQKKTFLYYNLQPSSPFAQNERPTGRKKIVYAGLLGVAQGIYEICQKVDFNQLNAELHIYGDGNEKEQIAELIQSRTGQHIYFHSTIPAHKMPEVLSGYHAALIPLKTNIGGALPSKVFMAIANGLPVIFSGDGEGAAIVKEHQLGWVNMPADYEQLSVNIRQFSTLSDKDYNEIRGRFFCNFNKDFRKENQDDTFCRFIEDL